MDANTVTLERALNETRTGDIWLFRGDSGPDRAIQTMTNAPVNHVGMTVAIDDMPPLMWHAELGDKLLDMWTGTNHRGVQLNDARAAVERWINNYGQRCWLRQITPDATREQEDQVLRVIARMDGTPFPSTARLTGRWFRGRVPTAADWTRGVPFLDKRVRESAQRKRADERNGLETAYCAETVAITYEEMGLLTTEKHTSWFDPGKFWSGDLLPLTEGYRLSDEIAEYSVKPCRRRRCDTFPEMRLTNAFFANHAEVVDDMLNITGGCWTSTTVADGSTAFGTRCVIFCEVSRQDRGKQFGLHIDAAGPTGQQWAPARSSYFTVPSRIAFMVTPPIALPIEPNGGLHVYTVRLEDHEERITLPLHVQVVAGSAFPSP